jgi:hypothetical protein
MQFRSIVASPPIHKRPFGERNSSRTFAPTYRHNATSPIRSKPCITIIRRRTRFYRSIHVANDLNQIFFHRIRRVSIAVKIRSEQTPKAPSTTIPPYSSGLRYMRRARNVNRRGVPTPIGEPSYRSTRRWRGQSWTLIYRPRDAVGHERPLCARSGRSGILFRGARLLSRYR